MPLDFSTLDLSKPWQVVETNAEDFLIGMAGLGYSQEMTLVGSFEDPDDTTKRTAHRDIDLPFHRDGIYTQSIADLQGGMYVERPNVDVVGMYCIRDNGAPCYTLLKKTEDGPAEHILATVNLRAGQALIWDNRIWHARRGEVGQRMLIRFWITCPEVAERKLVL